MAVNFNVVEETFCRFHVKWFHQTEKYLQELFQISKQGREASIEEEKKALVTKITTHIREYYTAKWASAEQDVFIFFDPVWLNSVELAFIWFTDWRPSSMFRIIDFIKNTEQPGPSLTELTAEQLGKIERLRKNIISEEKSVERHMERLHVSMGDNETIDLVRYMNRVKVRRNRALLSRVDNLVAGKLNGIKAMVEKEIKTADQTRLKTMKGILDILSPTQSVDFLIGKFMNQVWLRNEGRKIAIAMDS